MNLTLNIINNNLWEWKITFSFLYMENNIHRKQEVTNMPHTILLLEIFWIRPIFMNAKRNLNIDFTIYKMMYWNKWPGIKFDYMQSNRKFFFVSSIMKNESINWIGNWSCKAFVTGVVYEIDECKTEFQHWF